MPWSLPKEWSRQLRVQNVPTPARPTAAAQILVNQVGVTDLHRHVIDVAKLDVMLHHASTKEWFATNVKWVICRKYAKLQNTTQNLQ